MKDDDAWMAQGTGTNVKQRPRPEQPTIEQRAVRLAEVYTKAYCHLLDEMPKVSRFDIHTMAHHVAMLLVKRELETGDG